MEVVVGCGDSQFDILRIAASDAVNYDMGTEDLIKKLQEWDASFGVDVFLAETDTIQLRLKSMPSDLRQQTGSTHSTDSAEKPLITFSRFSG